MQQADTYRRMRTKTHGHWEEFHPETNALWLHYLVDVLLSHKKLPCSRAQLHALRGFRCPGGGGVGRGVWGGQTGGGYKVC